MKRRIAAYVAFLPFVLAEVPFEKGRIILFGFPATYHAQPYGTFKLLFNAIFYGAAATAAKS